ncbi:hypothetical protein GGI43DRAFT_311455 [Trichoderma evansii]
MDSSSNNSDPIHNSSKSQAAKPRSVTRDFTEKQLQAIGDLHLNQPRTLGYSEEHMEKLRSLGDAWGNVHHGVQGRSTALNELRDGFRDLKKDVEAVEKLLKSKKKDERMRH